MRRILAALIASVGLPFGAAVAEDQPNTKKFLKDGSWQGEVTAEKWGGINTAEAWATGRRSAQDAANACDTQGREDDGCVEEMQFDAVLVEIFADCPEGVAWQKAYPDRYTLTGVVSETNPDSHRGRATVASWFEFLCPQKWAKR